MAYRFSHCEQKKKELIEKIKHHRHVERAMKYKTSSARLNRKQTCMQMARITDVSAENIKSRGAAAKGRNHLSHSRPFPHCLHPAPSLLTRIIFHFRCNLPPSSLPLFPVLFFRLSSVLLWACVWWYQVQLDPTPHRQQPGWYPALCSPVHCNSATMSTRSVLDG